MRVVIGEDEALLRQGLVLVLRDAGVDVAGVASDAPGLIRKVAAHDPDLVISDIRMPPVTPTTGSAPRLKSARRSRRGRS